MKGKTLIRRKDIDGLFDRPKEYQARTGKIHEKREYYTVSQIVNKFHTTRRAVWNRCEKYGIKKVYQGRNTFYDKALVDIHFAELIAEVDMNDYYTIDQIMEKFSMSHAAVLSFVQRNDIPRITQGRKVYYSRAHIDTFKGERENVDPLYYTYKDIHEKYKLSKDQINYYVHNYNIPNHKQGRLTIVERNSFDRIIKERMNTSFLDKEVEKRKKQKKTDKVPDGYISIKQIAEQYGITEKAAQAKTREGKLEKLFIKHRNYFNANAVEQLFNRDPEKFDVPEDYITAQKIAERFKITVHHVHGRTRQAKVPRITIKHINFYELKAVEELFGHRVPVSESVEGDSIEWITGEQIEELYGLSTAARRTLVSRHKIPSKKVHETTFYSKADVEYARNPGLKDQKDYYTVEQIKEKFGLSREEVYSLARYKNIQKKRDGRFTLFLKEDVIRAIQLTDDEALQRILDNDMEKWQIFLHPSQQKLVNADYKGTMKVSGGAGTGKTVAALHRLKFLSANPNAKILFTTYTRTLKENLEDLIKKMDINQNRCTLSNIDQVLIEIAKQYKIKDGYKVLDYSGNEESIKLWREVLETEVTEFDEQFLYDEYIDVIVYFGNTDAKSYMMQQRVGRTKALSRKQRIEIWKLVEKYVALKNERKVVDRLELFNETSKYLNENNIRPYTNVIADEFQDFSNPELKFLRSLVEEGKNDLFLTGDPMQRIYSGRKINFSAAGINVRGVRSRRLKINYRTTEPIKRVAVGVIKGQVYDDMDGGTESIKGYVSLIHGGETPLYKIVSNASDEVTQIVEWVNQCTESDILLKDICIASPSMGLMKDLQSHLHVNGIEYKVLKGTSKVGSNNGISLCTFHSLKGLEFKVIILKGVNERNIPSKATDSYPFNGMDVLEKKEFLSSKRSLLYVAITRARQLVYMVGYGEPCGLLENINKTI